MIPFPPLSMHMTSPREQQVIAARAHALASPPSTPCEGSSGDTMAFSTVSKPLEHKVVLVHRQRNLSEQDQDTRDAVNGLPPWNTQDGSSHGGSQGQQLPPCRDLIRDVDPLDFHSLCSRPPPLEPGLNQYRGLDQFGRRGSDSSNISLPSLATVASSANSSFNSVGNTPCPSPRTIESPLDPFGVFLRIVPPPRSPVQDIVSKAVGPRRDDRRRATKSTRPSRPMLAVAETDRKTLQVVKQLASESASDNDEATLSDPDKKKTRARPVRRDGETHCNIPYTKEQNDFITYCHADLHWPWDDIATGFNSLWPEVKRRKDGLTSTCYRQNGEKIPELDADDMMILDDNGSGLYRGVRYKVRKGKKGQVRQGKVGLLKRFPEDLVDELDKQDGRYSWLVPEHAAEARALARRRKIQREEWQRRRDWNRPVVRTAQHFKALL